MSRGRPVALLAVLLLLGAVRTCEAQVWSREEVEKLWEELLRKERYEVVEYLGGPRSLEPTARYVTDDKSIKVQEGRKGYLWGLFGLSDGGGWAVMGQLEAEISIEGGVLQLYSKEIIHWRPGFAFLWMPNYDPEKYPVWEFRLIARPSGRRQKIRVLRSVVLAPGDVLPRREPDGTSVEELIGRRIPRGNLQYDGARHMAVVQIVGLHRPITEQISIPPAVFSDATGR